MSKNVAVVNSGFDTTTTGLVQFSNFPQDVLILVLTELDIPSLLVCKLVCRSLAYVISNDVFLQYAIELERTGMSDILLGAGLGPTVAARLALLREYHAAWRSLCFTTEVDVGEPAARAGAAHMRVLEVVSDRRVLLRRYSNNSLEVLQLPSRIRGICERRWAIDGVAVGVEMAKCVADSTQDLLIVLETMQLGGHAHFGNVHVRALSTGAPHPLAACAVLPVRPITFFEAQYAHVRVRADVMAHVLSTFTVPYSEVRLWNWKTSQLIWYRSWGNSSIYSLAFLDSTRFMIAGHSGLAIHNYDVEARMPPQYHGDGNGVCRLGFPELAEGSILHRCELSSCSRTPSPRRPPSDGHAGFDMVSDDPLVTISFTVAVMQRGYRAQEQAFVVVIPRRTLLALVDGAAASGEARKLAWREWCSRDVRIIERPLRCAADAAVLGWTVCDASHALRMDPLVGMYDFHRSALIPHTAAGMDGGETRVLVMAAGESSSAFPRYFKERFVSSIHREVFQRRVPVVAKGQPRGYQVHVIFTLDGFVVFDASLLQGRAYLF